MRKPHVSWLVLTRELPETIRVGSERRPSAAMVLDVDTSLVRGVAIGSTPGIALARAFRMALTKRAGDLPPRTPGDVLCAPELVPAVEAALADALPERPPVHEVQPLDEAEDLFDSFLGHMAGRAQPTDPPTPEDWRALVDVGLVFRRDQPWRRWSDERELALELRPPGHTVARYTAIVMGQAGVQHGVAFYPGDELPPGLRSAHRPEQEPAPPPGTLLFLLDPVAELPSDVIAKAVRYGWPPDDELAPFFMTFTQQGPAEVGAAEARTLAAAVAAVSALDRRGPALAGAATEPVTGSVRVGDSSPVSYRVAHRRTAPEAAGGPALRIFEAGSDLVPASTPVSLGHTSWASLPHLRTRARVHRPAPADAPAPRGGELPMFAVVVRRPEDGPPVTAKIAELDPYGVAIVESDDRAVVVLAGGNGAETLLVLPSRHRAVRAFRRRLRATRGRHVVMVADEATQRGEGVVYGLFECHQPPAPPAGRAKP